MFVARAFMTAFFSVVALFLLTKLIGSKQISQMSMFDYINGITIGSIAADLAIADKTDEFIMALAAMITYAVIGYAISIATIKSVRMRRFLSGKALILIENGSIYRENLRKCKLDLNDILTLARNQGYFNLSQISYAVMENNGSISFLQEAQSRPLTAADMNISVTEEKLVYNVIIDGRLFPDNLRRTGNDEQWLKAQLKAQGFGGYCEIMLATVDFQNNLTVFRMISRSENKNVFD